MSSPKAIFCWSGGKDSALALHKVFQKKEYQVVALLTTVSEEHRRISMHGVREELVEEQAAQIGLPLEKVYIPADPKHGSYERSMENVLKKFKLQGVDTVIFGDIFLEDLKVYRENNLKQLGMKAVFPLWKQDTLRLVKEFIELEFKSLLCCVSAKYFSKEHAGKIIDTHFIKNLPYRVDPCGENGEFHSFVFAGPLFQRAINIEIGEKLLKNYEHAGETHGFWFAELLKS